jgi:hypothetical protein
MLIAGRFPTGSRDSLGLARHHRQGVDRNGIALIGNT